MWHDASEATKASSGSTPAASDIGTGTTFGELEAGTTAPPSKRHWWAREYLLSLNFASPRCQATVAVYSCLLIGRASAPGRAQVCSTRGICRPPAVGLVWPGRCFAAPLSPPGFPPVRSIIGGGK